MFSNLVKSVSNLVQQAGTANAFPYTIGEVILEWEQSHDIDNTIWKLLEGQKHGTEEKVTIFALDRKNATQNRVDAALNCLNELKRIRHPHILKYEDSLITDNEIYFVTEYVYPLSACIQSIGNAHQMNESFIALGLFQIASALAFVHSELSYVHCLVSPSSIFVNKAGDFKLGSFELAHTHRNIPSHFLANFDLFSKRYRPKELSSSPSNDIINVFISNSNPIHSIDSWCLGCIIFELFNKKFTKPQQLSKLSAIPSTLHSYYKRLLATKPSSRMTLSSVLQCEFIAQNSLVQTSEFLEEIAIKSDTEKREFLQHLDANIESYPSSICNYKILPALTHLLQHGFGSNPLILSCVLKINPPKDTVRPLIVNMFTNNERGTRINLLKSLPKFIDKLDSECVSNDIFPQLINGFTDSSPVLREQSVRSVIHIVPKLTHDIISNKLLPLLDKIQSNDVEPAIRTNICIVLGKIAKFVICNSNNELVVMKCFVCALNDPFVPCRNAALHSFAANIALFSPNTISHKILPFCIKYCCDPHKDTRDSAFKCIEIGLQKLKQHALTLTDKPVTNNDNNPTNEKNGTPNPTDENASYLGGVSSWAQRISGYADNDKQIKETTNDTKPVQAEQLHSKSDESRKMQLQKPKESNESQAQSLDDFLASFNDDLNKIKPKSNEVAPKSKIKYKNKGRKKKSKRSKSKNAKPKQKAKVKNDDDFFDDW
eukprot:116393_1